MSGSFISDAVSHRIVLFLAVSFLVSACGTTASVRPKDVYADDFENSVIIVGSIESPADEYRDTLMFWNAGDQEQQWIIGNEQMVSVARSDVELSLFAIALPPGKYVYSNYMSEYRSGTQLSGKMEARSNYRGNELLTPEPMQAGDFVYMGRAVCRTHMAGCNWSLENAVEIDLPLLKSANPRLPWKNLQNRFQLNVEANERMKEKCESGEVDCTTLLASAEWQSNCDGSPGVCLLMRMQKLGSDDEGDIGGAALILDGASGLTRQMGVLLPADVGVGSSVDLALVDADERGKASSMQPGEGLFTLEVNECGEQFCLAVASSGTQSGDKSLVMEFTQRDYALVRFERGGEPETFMVPLDRLNETLGAIRRR